jgi:hypothetical protein
MTMGRDRQCQLEGEGGAGVFAQQGGSAAPPAAPMIPTMPSQIPPPAAEPQTQP